MLHLSRDEDEDSLMAVLASYSSDEETDADQPEVLVDMTSVGIIFSARIRFKSLSMSQSPMSMG